MTKRARPDIGPLACTSDGTKGRARIAAVIIARYSGSNERTPARPSMISPVSDLRPEPHYTGYAPATPARIAPLAVLPVFFKLSGKRVVLAGGSAGAAWKAELLAAAGAKVEVYAEAPGEEMRNVAAEHPASIRLLARPWSTDVLMGAAMAIGAIEDDAEGEAFACAAKAAGVPVNVVDRPRFCDFSFGAIVNRSPLIVGISTDGAAPVLGQAVRTRIDALLPQAFQRWAEAARDWRSAIKASGLGFAARREFWRLFTNHAVKNPQALPDPAQRETWLKQAAGGEASGAGSLVYVNSGGGEAEMLTLKAVRMLQTADVIFALPETPADILDLARREAKKVISNDEKREEMLALARAGSRVVRLGGTMPGIDVIEAMRSDGVAVEVV